MPKRLDLSWSLEIELIWAFDTEFQTIFNKTCTYITLMSAVKHIKLSCSYLYISSNFPSIICPSPYFTILT